MDLGLYPNFEGCNIVRSSSSGNYTYSVAAEWADRPVNGVSWGDAARFCNRMHNGQPTGAQDLTTTEDGSYYLNGATSNGELMTIVRKFDATWVLPSEDEWYKSAYHYNDGVTGNYCDYPTQSDPAPRPETDRTRGQGRRKGLPGHLSVRIGERTLEDESIRDPPYTSHQF